MKILGIIPAKGKSKGLPNKNIRPLLGKPTIYYAVKSGKEAKGITRLVCSTEDKRIADIVRKMKVETLDRPKFLAKDDTRIDEVLRHVVKEMEKKGFFAEAVLMLMANVPVMEEGIIDRAIGEFKKTKADSVITVKDLGQYNPAWALKLTGRNQVQLFFPTNVYRRQDLPKCYTYDGAVLIVRKDVLMANNGSNSLYPFLGEDIRAIIQNPDKVVDIDNESDFYMAETILKNQKS